MTDTTSRQSLRGTNLFSLDGYHEARTNWAHGQAFASAAGRAVASLHRGIDFGASIDLEAQLSGVVRDGVMATFAAGGDIKAGLTLQAALPLDLFKEAGLVARLQAQAEAAAFIKAEVGLDADLFHQLIREKLSGPWQDLALILFDELEVGAGVWGRAAFAAEAEAEAALVGSLMPGPDGSPPGFTFSFQFGAGLEFGAGLHFLVNLGFRDRDSRQLLNRLSDRLAAILERALEQRVNKSGGPAARKALPYCKLLLPLACRTAFELGADLVQRKVGEHKDGAATVVVRSFAREAEKLLLRALFDLALNELNALLRKIPFVKKLEDLPPADRETLADALRDAGAKLGRVMTREHASVADWFQAVLALLDPLMAVLTLGRKAKLFEAADEERWQENVALLWAAGVLAQQVVTWSQEALDARTTDTPFDGTPASIPAGSPVVAYVASRIKKPAGSALTLADVVVFLVGPPGDRTRSGDRMAALCRAFPEGAGVWSWLAAALGNKDVSALLQMLLHDLAGVRKDYARTVFAALLKAAGAKVEEEIFPRVFKPLEQSDPDLAKVIQRVAKPALLSLTRVLLPGVARLGTEEAAQVLREQLSAVLLQVLARLLLTATDVVLEKGLRDGGGALRDLAKRVARPDPQDGGAQTALQRVIRPAALQGLTLAPPEAGDLLLLCADALDRINERERQPAFDALELLVSLGLTTGGDLDPIWATLGRPNDPPMPEALKRLAVQLGHGTWDLLQYLSGRANQLWLAYLEREGKAVLQTLENSAREAAAALDQAIKTLDQDVKQLQALAVQLEQDVRNLLANKLNPLLADLTHYLKGRREALIRAVYDMGWQTIRAAVVQNWVYKHVPAPVQQDYLRKVQTLYDTAFAAASPGLAAPLTLLEKFAGFVDEEVKGEVRAKTLDRDWLMASLRARAWTVGAADLQFPIRVGKLNLGTITLPAANVLGTLVSGVLDDPAVRRALDGALDVGRQAASRQAQLDTTRTAIARKMSKKDAQQAAGRLFPGKPLDIRVEAPEEQRTYPDKVRLRVVLPGANRTFLGSDMGIPARVKLFINGADYDYKEENWQENPGALVFETDLVTGIPQAGPGRPVRLGFHSGPLVRPRVGGPKVGDPDPDVGPAARPILLRPGLNTVQVTVVDGKGQRKQVVRMFYLQKTKRP